MLTKQEQSYGKVRTQDELTSRMLTWAPAIMTGLAIVPLPVLFLVLFITSSSTDAAALYILLSLLSLGLGLAVALLILIGFGLYRRRWKRRVRDRLASDGITAAELVWFHPELSTEERKTWRELEAMNPLLADAYAETLAARLTATRIAAKAREEGLHIERQINRTRHLRNADTNSLLEDLTYDRGKADSIRKEAKMREVQAKARLQTIEAAARRELTEAETSVMLRRLHASQDQIPLGLEIATLEQEARNRTRNSKITNPAEPT
ncbi:MAG TPA: hypothetical protein VJU84_04655 [Pyrinomonadaceae bacterium]|nr:hypothetical protein [Pyrinomonadaceae bacterium]